MTPPMVLLYIVINNKESAVTPPLDPQFQKYAQVKLTGLPLRSMTSVLALSGEGGTIPFIARYRKEATGNMDEVQVRAILEAFEDWGELVKRKAFVLVEIEKQGGLTAELKSQIESSNELREVEELYQPFKRKKKTKAQLAREAGIEPLAHWIWQQGQGEIEDSTTVEVKAKEYINAKAGYATYDEVLRGAKHIIVEKLTSMRGLRQVVKSDGAAHGQIVCQKSAKFKKDSKYEMYAEFSDSIKNLLNKKASHRYLALRRGWQEGELKVTLTFREEELLKTFEAEAIKKRGSMVELILKQAAETALKIHVIPSVTNEQHSLLKEKADQFAIEVFAANVKRVLMSGPFGPKVVLGVDPGLRTGCKLALIDKGGRFISSTVMSILGDKAKDSAKKLFEEVFKQIQIEAIAIGNGTGGREAEKFIRNLLKEVGKDTPVVMVNEAGASIYSASKVAREEFSDLDLTVRGAISIARRLQDPLAELVKIDPKSIGVGQYQHDVTQGHLKKSLHGVVESCVNQVGVDVNTASSYLLQYVSGIGPALSKAIISFRNEKGLFKERSELMNVSRFSSKIFEQSAGFLRVSGGVMPLDETGIHPERYMAVKEMAKEAGVSILKLLKGNGVEELKRNRDKWVQLVGEYTFDDIITEIQGERRDPRDPYQVFKFCEDIHEIKDLKVDMIYPGIVSNVTNFGAFVDIGVHQDGLVHISQLSHSFLDDPRLLVNPGDQVKVKVIKIDEDRGQIFLSMRLTEKPRVKARAKSKTRESKARESKARESRAQEPRTQAKAKRTGERGQDKSYSSASDRPKKTRIVKGKKSQHKEARGRVSKKDHGNRNQRSQRNPFNNPFAALTELKK